MAPRPRRAGSGAQPTHAAVDRRVLMITALAIVVAGVASVIARLLGASIAFITQLAFYGRISLQTVSPVGHDLGLAVIGVPVVGALIIGVMARYGSSAIRGHGIPEAMEQVLFNQSRIPARVLLLKPLSAVISIGTGGPFGAEGPIIATGSALGSLFGQFTPISAEERKTLLAAGAAAGMAATFGSPVAAVLLAIELLLFEYRVRSLVPVCLASVTATGVRIAFAGSGPAFSVATLSEPPPRALAAYVLIGALCGVAAVLVTKAVYAMEDAFERLPLHWMWWPALGALAVGVIGVVEPRTLGVGYDNIENIVSGHVAGSALLALCTWKFCSWVVALGSGTSGGTLAPLFTIGGGLGGLLATWIAKLAPGLGVDARLGALVGMAALFAGASRAVLASVVFAFETTQQSLGLLPLLGGCGAAYLISCTLMKHSIMTEKIARRGLRVPCEYAADYLEQVQVRDVALRDVVCLRDEQRLADVRAWIASGVVGSDHHAFVVLDATEHVKGVVTRRDLFRALHDPRQRAAELLIADLLHRPAVNVLPTASLREASDLMVMQSVGRLPVVDGDTLIGLVTRSDLVDVHRRRLAGESPLETVQPA